MKPLDLKEFAEGLRTSGNWREADFATEILDLLDLEEEIAEPYGNLCEDLNFYAPESLKDKPEKQCEWLGDRNGVLEEIEKVLKEAGREPGPGSDTEDAIKELLDTLAQAEEILEAAGWPGDGDFIEGIQSLANRPAREYDL